MIDFIHVRKSFVDKDLLKDATVRINKGEHVGIVGPNGAGKSTLFNMIIGDMEPDKGEIHLPKGMRLGYLKQQLQYGDCDEPLVEFTADAMPELRELHHQIHVLEAKLAQGADDATLRRLGDVQTMYENYGGYEMEAKAAAALSGLGFQPEDLEKPLKAFSGGWQMRALLAQTLILDPDILLLDEPSNYLDVPAVEWMQRYLKNFKGTMLLISHDRFLLNTLTTVTIEVNAGLVNRYPGNYDYYARERDNRFQSLQAAKENQDKRKEQLQRSISRFRAKSSKASQVQSWVKSIEKMEEIDVPDALNYSGQIRLPPAPPSGVEVCRLEEICHSYDGKKWVLKNVELRIERGDKIGIIGYNGMGKTTLLRIIAGQLAATEGKRVLGHKVVAGYQAQEFAEILPLEETLFTIVRQAAPERVTDQDVRNALASFGFQGEAIAKPCDVLSGGEKIRLAFARIFIHPPNLLVLDEPTTHLDVAAREGLQEAIHQYDGTVCLVSHDIEFIRNTATTILAMDGNMGVKKYFGDYDYYCTKIAEQRGNTVGRPTVATAPKEQKGQHRKSSDQQKQAERRERELTKKAAVLEADIDRWIREKGELAQQLTANAPNTDYAGISRRLKELDEQIDIASDEWNTVTEDLERVRSVIAP